MIHLGRTAVLLVLVGCLLPAAARSQSSGPSPWDPARGILIEGATVVAMDDEHTVIVRALRLGTVGECMGKPVDIAGSAVVDDRDARCRSRGARATFA